MNLKLSTTIKYLNEKSERERERVKELEEKPWDVFPGEKTQSIQANLKSFF